MSKMTEQEVFDTVVRHLAKQGGKAMEFIPNEEFGGGQTKCCYRTKGGASCSIGCLIPDSEYDPSLEGHGVAYLSEVDKLPASLKKYRLELLRGLQRAHDMSVTGVDLRNQLHYVAAGFSLDTSVLDSVTFPDSWEAGRVMEITRAGLSEAIAYVKKYYGMPGDTLETGTPMLNAVIEAATRYHSTMPSPVTVWDVEATYHSGKAGDKPMLYVNRWREKKNAEEAAEGYRNYRRDYPLYGYYTDVKVVERETEITNE